MRISDWSSDVCSSDLLLGNQAAEQSLDGGKTPSARLANAVANLGGGQRAVVPQRLHHRMFRFANAFGLAVFAVRHGHLPSLMTMFVAITTTLVNTNRGLTCPCIDQRSEERSGGKEGVSQCRSR